MITRGVPMPFCGKSSVPACLSELFARSSAWDTLRDNMNAIRAGSARGPVCLLNGSDAQEFIVCTY